MSLKGKHGEAEAAFRKAIALLPGRADTNRSLSLALMRQARFPEAVAAVKSAIELQLTRSVDA